MKLGWVIVYCAALFGQAAAQQPRDSVLLNKARQQPDSLRQSITQTLSLAAHVHDARASAAHVIEAEHLARIYARAWSDSFFIRQVGYFAHWSPAQRLAKSLA